MDTKSVSLMHFLMPPKIAMYAGIYKMISIMVFYTLASLIKRIKLLNLQRIVIIILFICIMDFILRILFLYDAQP